jgi:hypothetical protein
MIEVPMTHTVNVPLLRKVLEHVTAHPEEWNQKWWATKTTESSCGTACCVAGWAVSWAGHDFKWDSNGEASVYIRERDARAIPHVAQELLGLNPEQAGILFFSGNTLPMLWEFANEFTEGEIEIPEDVK